MNWNYMPDTMYYMQKAAEARKVFKNFTLSSINRSENGIEVYDWRNKNGSGEYHIRFVADIYNGALYITGDLGQGLLQVTGDFTLKDWADVTPDYFEEKIRCCSEQPRFDENWFREDFICELHEQGYDFYEQQDDNKELLQELVEFFFDNAEGYPPERLRDRFIQVTDIYELEWMRSCGRRFPGRVIYWKIALEMIKEVI